MNCIFCHEISDSSKSVEHIIPESLGNKDTILWRGAVCDKCNNYFATKIEKPLLDQPYFVSVRQRNFIKTKKDRWVKDKLLFHGPDGGWVETQISEDNNHLIIAFDEDNELWNSLKNGRINEIISPIIVEPELNNHTLSRFLAKCAFEFLVHRVGENHFLEFSEYLRNKQFDPLRRYARYGEGCEMWPYSQRRIYGEGDGFFGRHEEIVYEILNEMDFLTIELGREIINNNEYVHTEFYYVLVIMGVEYAINFAGPDISGYNQWLQRNNGVSPVFRDDETRFPNMSTSSLHITEELIRKMNDNR